MEADFRGRGVGAALYTRLLDDLRARGFHSAIGGVTLPNPASVRLHERLGFQPVGVVRQAGHKFGQWLDVGFWQLLLRDGDHQPAAGRDR
jgi:phosphinothricin acetyltransferase